MNITFLIGNGFDINLDIKSSYNDFYQWYIETPSASSHIAKFKKEIANEIKDGTPPGEQTWADLELGLGRYTAGFSKKTVDLFLDCLEDAQDNIRQYLYSQEKKFQIDKYDLSSIKNFHDSLVKFTDELSDTSKTQVNSIMSKIPYENRQISFITFNYTNTLEKLLEGAYDTPLSTWQHNAKTYSYNLNPNIIHVHGTIEDFPVLGVDNKDQVANPELFETPQFSEMLIKAENVQALGKVWHIQAEQQIAKSKIVCVYGMSLGASDAKWWRQLAQWLKADTSRQLIVYWYEKKISNRPSSRWQIAKMNEIKEKLLSFSNLSKNDIDALKSRIHIVINTKNFLCLKETSQLEVQKDFDETELMVTMS